MAKVNKKFTEKSKVRGKKKSYMVAIVIIYASFNNTIVTFTDVDGNVLAWCSAGAAGFKGSRKCMPFAATVSAQKAVERAKAVCDIRSLKIKLKGPGPGRDHAARAIGNCGIPVASISDNTPLPHNGCRPPGKRRV